MSRFMEPIHHVIYDGVPLSDFGVYSSGRGTYSSAERDYEVEEVPGRSGDLLFDKGRYKNIEVSYPSFIIDNSENNLDALRNYLATNKDYKKLEDTFHPDTFRLGYYRGGLQVETGNLNEAFAFELIFNCKPQRFYKSGEIGVPINQNGGINNPSYQPSSPIIRVYGYGTINIGSYQIVVAQNDKPYIDIDCDLQNAYYDTQDCNNYISVTNNEFPVLHSGFNGIELNGTGMSLIITPRWWKL